MFSLICPQTEGSIEPESPTFLGGIGSVVFQTRWLFGIYHLFYYFVMRPSWKADGDAGQKFSRGPLKDHSTNVKSTLAKRFLRSWELVKADDRRSIDDGRHVMAKSHMAFEARWANNRVKIKGLINHSFRTLKGYVKCWN